MFCSDNHSTAENTARKCNVSIAKPGLVTFCAYRYEAGTFACHASCVVDPPIEQSPILHPVCEAHIHGERMGEFNISPTFALIWLDMAQLFAQSLIHATLDLVRCRRLQLSLFLSCVRDERVCVRGGVGGKEKKRDRGRGTETERGRQQACVCLCV